MPYIMANPTSYLPIGVSPLETLKYAVDAHAAGRRVQRAPDHAARRLTA